ncbi:MAG: HlyC/CorC family transporter [Deltaproteobacteria bacterium]|nr:HlyC/CorC family transporter [Deltaproteobacteria bacterium]
MILVTSLVFVAMCVLTEAFFSGSEIALVHADRTRLQIKAEEGHRGAQLALELLNHEERFLATCLIGTNLSTITATTVVSSLFLLYLGRNEQWLIAPLMVPLILTFGEALPKTVFRHHANAIAPVIAAPLYFFQRLLSVPVALASGWSRLLLRILGGGGQSPITRNDILSLIDEDEAGTLHTDQSVLIRRVFAISNTTVEEIMTPLVEVNAVEEGESVHLAAQLAMKSGHSRIPVFRDRVDNVVGLVHVRELLFSADATIESILRPVWFIPESTHVDNALRQMRTHGEPFAVVVDEYGGCVGLVTVEDLLEEIFGEIHDERDEVEQRIQRLPSGQWSIPGRVEIGTLEDELGISAPEGDFETVAGMILATTGRIPQVGDVVKIGNLRIEITEGSERAIQRVRVTVITP